MDRDCYFLCIHNIRVQKEFCYNILSSVDIVPFSLIAFTIADIIQQIRRQLSVLYFGKVIVRGNLLGNYWL